MMGTGFIDHSAGSSGAALVTSGAQEAGGETPRSPTTSPRSSATAGAGEKVDIKLIGDTLHCVTLFSNLSNVDIDTVMKTTHSRS